MRVRALLGVLAEHAILFGLIVGSAFVAMRLISLPPTHLTAIWLPGGIALIALLKRPGWWSLPTIWLANWAVMAAANHYPFFVFRPYGSALCAVNMLTPALGCWIWKQWLGTSPFKDGWSYLKFAFGVALAPALISGWLVMAIIVAAGG
ncbi:MAG TPA: hypothetical protein VHV47_04015, partial [Opitutaceae bacterium]|nr:hypothetical protein [Opitutaceae bacterium]